jgi:hypothetical protein
MTIADALCRNRLALQEKVSLFREGDRGFESLLLRHPVCLAGESRGCERTRPGATSRLGTAETVVWRFRSGLQCDEGEKWLGTALIFLIPYRLGKLGTGGEGNEQDPG